MIELSDEDIMEMHTDAAALLRSPLMCAEVIRILNFASKNREISENDNEYIESVSKIPLTLISLKRALTNIHQYPGENVPYVHIVPTDQEISKILSFAPTIIAYHSAIGELEILFTWDQLIDSYQLFFENRDLIYMITSNDGDTLKMRTVIRTAVQEEMSVLEFVNLTMDVR